MMDESHPGLLLGAVLDEASPVFRLFEVGSGDPSLDRGEVHGVLGAEASLEMSSASGAFFLLENVGAIICFEGVDGAGDIGLSVVVEGEAESA